MKKKLREKFQKLEFKAKDSEENKQFISRSTESILKKNEELNEIIQNKVSEIQSLKMQIISLINSKEKNEEKVMQFEKFISKFELIEEENRFKEEGYIVKLEEKENLIQKYERNFEEFNIQINLLKQEQQEYKFKMDKNSKKNLEIVDKMEIFQENCNQKQIDLERVISGLTHRNEVLEKRVKTMEEIEEILRNDIREKNLQVENLKKSLEKNQNEFQDTLIDKEEFLEGEFRKMNDVITRKNEEINYFRNLKDKFENEKDNLYEEYEKNCKKI